MILRARRLKIPLIAVPESWLLPPENDERDRKILELESQVRTLKSSDAELTLSLTDVNGESLEAISGTFQQFPELTEMEKLQIIESIKKKHPEVDTNLVFDADSPMNPLAGLNLTIARASGWTESTTEQIRQYHKDYSEWIESAQMQLAQLDTTLNARHRPQEFQICLRNSSCRPADQVLLELNVHGGVMLVMTTGDAVPDLIVKTRELPLGLVLPSPPAPPRGENIYETLARTAQSFRDDADFNVRFQNQRIREVSGLRSRLAPRDRHTFYRREQDENPAKSASFSCEELRHQRAPEIFRLWVIAPIRSDRGNATLHIRASARNLTTPVDLYVPVTLEPAHRPTYEIAAQWQVKSYRSSAGDMTQRNVGGPILFTRYRHNSHRTQCHREIDGERRDNTASARQTQE